MRLTRTQARRIMPVVAFGLSALLGAAMITSADAEPEVTKKDVETAFHEAEVINEQVNQLNEDVKQTSQQIADLTSDIAAQKKVYDKQREALSATIVQQQMDAPLGTTASLLGSGDPAVFIDGLGAVQALNASRTDQLDAFTAAADKLRNRQDQLKDRKSSLKADRAEATKKQAVIQAKYTKAKADLARLTAAQQASFNATDTDADFDINAKGRAKKALEFARAQLGEPYVYGGTGPNGWDCSGLVMKSYAAAGVSLPRVVGPQMSAVKRVSMSDLEPGDLVAYGDMSHDGLYLGGGRVIHAPRPGKNVEITSLSGFTVAGRVG